MFHCPQCKTALSRTQTKSGIFWVCPTCGGRAVTVPLLRQLISDSTMRELWSRTFDRSLSRKRPCPSCRKPMQLVPLDAGQLKVDVCRNCQFVWFDPNEFEELPQKPPAPVVVDSTPRPIREAIAMHEVERVSKELNQSEPEWNELRNVPALLGLPVETEAAPNRQVPWLTWSVAVTVAITSILAFAHTEIFDEWALIPAEAWRMGGVTFISSFFLHAGFWHLVTNLYFLAVFGDNVEEYLGKVRWGILVLSATLFGGLLHVLANQHDTVPCAGASSGISGLLAFYAFRFPQTRLGLRIWLGFAFRAPWITFPAWAGFAAWLVLQLVGVVEQLSGLGKVSAIAHLGGVLVGIAAWLVWRSIEVPNSALPLAPTGEAPPFKSK